MFAPPADMLERVIERPPRFHMFFVGTADNLHITFPFSNPIRRPFHAVECRAVAEARRQPISLSSHSLPRCTGGALLETSEIGPKLHHPPAFAEVMKQKYCSSSTKTKILFRKKKNKKEKKNFVAGEV